MSNFHYQSTLFKVRLQSEKVLLNRGPNFSHLHLLPPTSTYLPLTSTHHPPTFTHTHLSSFTLHPSPPTSTHLHLSPTYLHSPLPTSTNLPPTLTHFLPTSTHFKSAKMQPILVKFDLNKKACKLT